MLKEINKLWSLFNKNEKIKIFFLFIAVLLMTLAQVAGVASIFPFMNLVMDPGNIESSSFLNNIYNFFNFSSHRSFTIFAAVVMFLIILISNLISTFATWYKLKFVWENNHRLSMKLFRKYLLKPYSYFLLHNSSDLSKNVLQEVYFLSQQYLIQLVNLVTYLCVAVAFLTLLFIIDIKVTLTAVFLLGGSYSIIYFFIKKKMKESGCKRMKANEKRFKIVNEAFNGIKEIKISRSENEFIAEFNKHSKKNAGLMTMFQTYIELPHYTLETIAFGGVVLMVLYLIIVNEDVNQVIPKMALFAFAGYRLMPALQHIFQSLSSLLFNNAVLNRIYDDIIREEDFKSVLLNNNCNHVLNFEEKIVINNLSYRYPGDEKLVLKNINLEIKKHQKIAFAGSTGAGKSTLVDIILGLLEPLEGEVKVDGVKIDKGNLRSWQKNIGYVPQDIYLIDDTIIKNIAFGVEEEKINYSSVKKAAEIANIDQFIENKLKNGYKTIVGERGVRLSGGQKQRIGFARALYNDPEILVLDEATSSLDSKTQETVMNAVNNIAEVKTMIIIAHRSSTVENCDNIYLIEDGKIIDQGKYDELLQKNSYFREMAYKLK